MVDKTNEYEVKVRELTALKNKLEGERIRVEGLKRHADEIEAQCQVYQCLNAVVIGHLVNSGVGSNGPTMQRKYIQIELNQQRPSSS